MTYIAGVLAVLIAAETWCLWRLLALMRVLPRVEERMNSLVNTIALLTDTTEACFQTVATRLGDGPTLATSEGRQSRQRRVLGAAKRGQPAHEIAAREELAESEVRLRLHLGARTTGRTPEAA